jgi:aspartyl-tRNA(Asn)/glutamyl-tRNA(Gln) amidotransferase subunit C
MDKEEPDVIPRDEVEHIARLARLHFEEQELERFGADLSAIIDYVKTLGELDLSGVPPTSHAIALKNVLRADEPRLGLGQDQAVVNGPLVERGQFVVPRIG